MLITSLRILRRQCCKRKAEREQYYDDDKAQSSSIVSRSAVLRHLLGPPSSPSAVSKGVAGEAASDSGSFFAAFARLGLILAYFYVCDRTNYFMKENKYYTPLTFFLPVLYVFVLGLFFHEDTKSGKFLNRDQTDEWKGKKGD